MTDAKRKMHLAIQAAAPGHPAGWRVPGGERQAGDDVAHYQNVARICERALLDVLFLADSPSFTDDGRSPTRSLDPVVLITACALATEHLGLVLTGNRVFKSRLYREYDLGNARRKIASLRGTARLHQDRLPLRRPPHLHRPGGGVVRAGIVHGVDAVDVGPHAGTDVADQGAVVPAIP